MSRDGSTLPNAERAIEKTCVFFSRFVLTTQAGGGCRRELQNAEVLSPLDFQFISSQEYGERIPNLFRKMMTIGKDYYWWADEFKDYLYRLRKFSILWANKINKDTELVIVDDPIFFAPLVKKVKKLHIPLITLCQNLESLSFAQINPAKQLSLFNQELKLYQLSDLIITISREETTLLNNFNLKTFYLPYYPVDVIAERMLTIRSTRGNTHKTGLFLLGNANNRVTRDGMIEFLTYWKNGGHTQTAHKLIVAGYGTEQIKDLCDHEAIEFLGILPDGKHDDVLCTSEAVISYQTTGAGALTKNTEMLLAGIPVLANSQAARSYYNTAGIIEFNTLNEFGTALSKVKQWQGNIPLPHKPDTRQLLGFINNLCKKKLHDPEGTWNDVESLKKEFSRHLISIRYA